MKLTNPELIVKRSYKEVQEDLTIRSLGVKTYLLTDTLENKKNIPLEEVETEYKGTMEE